VEVEEGMIEVEGVGSSRLDYSQNSSTTNTDAMQAITLAETPMIFNQFPFYCYQFYRY